MRLAVRRCSGFLAGPSQPFGFKGVPVDQARLDLSGLLEHAVFIDAFEDPSIRTADTKTTLLNVSILPKRLQ